MAPIPQVVLLKFKNVRWLAIDEFSLISAGWLHWLSRVCQTISGVDSPFGSFNIILSGEALQLPCVFGTPLYKPVEECQDAFSEEGCRLFQTQFNTCFYIYGNKRVDQDAPDATAFRQLLHNLRAKNVSETDLALLRRRLKSNLSMEELAQFQDAPCILPYRKLCRKYNFFKLTV